MNFLVAGFYLCLLIQSLFGGPQDISLDLVASSPALYNHAIGGGSYNDRSAGTIALALNGFIFFLPPSSR